jgi:hypothetical protein
MEQAMPAGVVFANGSPPDLFSLPFLGGFGRRFL